MKTDTIRTQSCSPPPWISLALLEAGNESRVVPNNRYKHWELGIGTHNMQGLWGALNYCLGFKRCLGRHTPFSPQGYFTLMYGFPLQIGLIHLSRGFFFLLLPFSPFRGMGIELMALCTLGKPSITELPQPFPSLCILRKDLVKLPKLASALSSTNRLWTWGPLPQPPR